MASENFRGCLPQSSLKKLGQILTPLAILGHFERFSPGPNGSEVQQGYLRLFEAQLRSHLGQVKIFRINPKSLEQLGFCPNFSVMIEAGNPENFRLP